MSSRLLATALALLLGVLLGRYWPVPMREAAPRPEPNAPASVTTPHRSVAMRPSPTPGAAAQAATIAAPSAAALAVDASTLWPQARRQRQCTYWNRLQRASHGEATLDPENVGDELAWIDILIDGAAAQWHAQSREEQRVDLLQRWNVQLTNVCALLGEADEDTLYRSARDAALLGSRAARMDFLRNPPLPQLGAARRLDLWGDWVDTTSQLLDEMAANGDAEALFLRGIALGFDSRPYDEGIDGVLDYLAPAIDNDAARAYRDLRAYLASGDTRWSAIAQEVLPQVGARVDAAQRAAIDAEFAKH